MSAPDWEALGEACRKDWEATGEHVHPTPLAFDTETSGFGWNDQPFCATVAWRRPDTGLASHYLELTDPFSPTVLNDMLLSAERIIGHNLRFDYQMCAKFGVLEWGEIPFARWEDTETLCHLLNENKRKKLEFVAVHLLGETVDESEVLAQHRRDIGVKKEEGYGVLDREVLMPYAIKDAEYTLRIWEKLHPHVLATDEVFRLYRREMELMDVLMSVCRNGMRIDTAELVETIPSYGAEVMEAEHAVRVAADVDDLNPNSNPQLLAAFAGVGNTSLENVNKDTLGPLSERNSPGGRLAKTVLTYRKMSKVYSTYLIGLRDELGSDDILHVNIRQNGARTGRTSSAAESGD
jgi:DNA polymerase I-like protein with 3'-5' exonuclease and polymerase domains